VAFVSLVGGEGKGGIGLVGGSVTVDLPGEEPRHLLDGGMSPRHRDEKRPAGSAEGRASGDPRPYLILQR
jgi:hypothetical protein